ncbi:MAG: hypothetical protein ABFS86_20605 [Planctomycetota bacterium]
MGRTFLILLVFLVMVGLASVATPAFGKAPTLEELPTGKWIVAKSKEAIEVARLKAEEAKKDPKLDLINAYADPSGSFYDWAGVVEILKDGKEKPGYRQKAANAIRIRFRDVRADGRIRDVKKKIAQSIVRLLKDGNIDERTWVYGIFHEFYQGAAGRIGYNPAETNYMKRNKAYLDWVKYLRK